MAANSDWVFRAPGEGRTIWLGDQAGTFKVRGESNTHSVWELTVPAGGDVPIHSHSAQDETHCITEGEFQFLCGEEKMTAGPGAFVFVSKGLPHAFRNAGQDQGRMIVVNAPPGPLESFLEGFGEESRPPPGPPDMEKAMEVAERTKGINILGPPDGW